MEPKKSGEMRIKLPIDVTDRSQITNLPADTQTLKWRTTWRNLPYIFLILHDFDYPPFFSVSLASGSHPDDCRSLVRDSLPSGKFQSEYT
jgi:hypothetical protein